MFLSPFSVVANSLLGAYKNSVHISSPLIRQSGANTGTFLLVQHTCWNIWTTSYCTDIKYNYLRVLTLKLSSTRWSAATPPRVPKRAPSPANARTSALLLASGQKYSHCWSPQLHTRRVPQFHSGVQRTKPTIAFKFESFKDLLAL